MSVVMQSMIGRFCGCLARRDSCRSHCLIRTLGPHPIFLYRNNFLHDHSIRRSVGLWKLIDRQILLVQKLQHAKCQELVKLKTSNRSHVVCIDFQGKMILGGPRSVKKRHYSGQTFLRVSSLLNLHRPRHDRLPLTNTCAYHKRTRCLVHQWKIFVGV